MLSRQDVTPTINDEGDEDDDDGNMSWGIDQKEGFGGLRSLGREERSAIVDTRTVITVWNFEGSYQHNR